MYYLTLIDWHIRISGFNGLPEDLMGHFALRCLKLTMNQIEVINYFYGWE